MYCILEWLCYDYCVLMEGVEVTNKIRMGTKKTYLHWGVICVECDGEEWQVGIWVLDVMGFWKLDLDLEIPNHAHPWGLTMGPRVLCDFLVAGIIYNFSPYVASSQEAPSSTPNDPTD